MKVYWITSQTILPASAKGGVLLMGNFDGFHKGHQLLINAANNLRTKNNEKISLLTFYPHPAVLFLPQKTCFFINSLRTKLRLAQLLNIDRVYLCKFTPGLANLTAKKFTELFLSNMLAPDFIVVGSDFNFGKNKLGNVKTLQKSGFNVVCVNRAAPYSSSRARAFIEAGDMIGAISILGRPYEIEGYVKKGCQEARTLGFPTVNIPINNFIRPALGVYATQTFLNGGWHDSLSYFGRRKLDNEPVLETHIFNFTGDLYHQRLRVRFIDFIRKPQKFKYVPDIKHQLAQDAIAAKIKLDQK